MTDNKNHDTVNKALGFPKMEEFEAELLRLMNQTDTENSGSVILALTDCDNFGHINTDFGREYGDKVLIDTGLYLSSKLPDGATIYRVSGDEFGIIFNNDMEKEDVFLFLEEVRRGYDIKLRNGEQLTISIGIAAAFEDATRVQELIRKAESALFRAKATGHNKIALAKEEKMVPKTSHYTNDQLKCLTKLSKREGVGEAILLREALDMLLKKYDI
ncbi:MAG: diguanylate cyclase [Lachnospiraceae bacterium]|nr:diguanylate cyclase [Lachnospiraceae bacterium]